MARTVHYFAFDDLKGLVPDQWLTEAMDDALVGTPDSFDAIRDTAEDTIDGMLDSQYAVPIANAEKFTLLKSVGRYLAAKICYNRRQYEDKAFPHLTVFTSLWSKLEAIGEGKQQLSAGAQAAQLDRPRGAIITGPAKTYSSTGSFTA